MLTDFWRRQHLPDLVRTPNAAQFVASCAARCARHRFLEGHPVSLVRTPIAADRVLDAEENTSQHHGRLAPEDRLGQTHRLPPLSGGTARRPRPDRDARQPPNSPVQPKTGPPLPCPPPHPPPHRKPCLGSRHAYPRACAKCRTTSTPRCRWPGVARRSSTPHLLLDLDGTCRRPRPAPGSIFLKRWQPSLLVLRPWAGLRPQASGWGRLRRRGPPPGVTSTEQANQRPAGLVRWRSRHRGRLVHWREPADSRPVVHVDGRRARCARHEAGWRLDQRVNGLRPSKPVT